MEHQEFVIFSCQWNERARRMQLYLAFVTKMSQVFEPAVGGQMLEGGIVVKEEIAWQA